MPWINGEYEKFEDWEPDEELKRMVREIDNSDCGLSGWDLKFIGDLVDSGRDRFTEKQAKQIRRIHSFACK